MRNGEPSVLTSITAFPGRFARLFWTAIASAGIVVIPAATASAQMDFAPGAVSGPADLTAPDRGPVEMILMDLRRRRPSQPHDETTFETAPNSLALSPAALLVSQIAERNGDTRYLLVDKTHGKVVLFADGKPVFSGAALTGESLADRLPPDAVSKPVHQHVGVKYKVTPAGRFTMTRGHDPALGETLDINELQGSDWTIAVHQVYLGFRSEHRDARLLSPNDADKHITTGCIDVDAATIRQLLRLLPGGGATPIYILPTDEGLIATLFKTRDSGTGTRASLPVRHGPT